MASDFRENLKQRITSSPSFAAKMISSVPLPNKSPKLKDDFVNASDKDLYINGFIGGQLRHSELDDLNLLLRETADLFTDNYPPQYLPQIKQTRLEELSNQLGSFNGYLSNLDNLSNGVEISFKSQHFNPIENAYQVGSAWTKLKIHIQNSRIYGVTPLPSNMEPYDFLITLDGQLKIGLGHFNLSDKANKVLGAGRLKINIDGKIWWIDVGSGHYRPGEDNPAEVEAIRTLLRKNKLTAFLGE
ncbi:MAG: hypothetical protein R2828_28980 [Saprospiraceae bacterium]